MIPQSSGGGRNDRTKYIPIKIDEERPIQKNTNNEIIMQTIKMWIQCQ